MIIARLFGGLGNQMFQYAIGRKLALLQQTDVVLDTTWYTNTPASNTQRKFELWKYPIVVRELSIKELLWCGLHAGRLTGRLGINWGGYRILRERGFDFDSSILNLRDNTYLSGYWQSQFYFEDIADIIRRELTPNALPCLEDAELINRMRLTNSVSVHVRRGDYVTQKAASRTHGICSVEYYMSAIERIRSQVSDPHFFVFSDDMDWVKNNMVFPGCTIYVDHNNSETAFQDLRLMSTCRHHVIANSSFSWWGAWLNPSEEKYVIAPEMWFADNRPTPTLMPKTWIRL